MDTANLVLLIAIAVFGYRGYRAGVFLSGGRIAALLAGYGASLTLAKPASSWLTQAFELSPWVSFTAASIGLFFLVSALVTTVISRLTKQLPLELQHAKAVRWGGAGLGVVTGCLIAVITLWFYNAMVGAISLSSPAMGQRLQAASGMDSNSPSAGQQLVNSASQLVADAVVKRSDSDDFAAQATALLMTQPQATMESFQRLGQDPAMLALLQTPENQQVLLTGNSDEITQLKDFQALRNNPDMQSLFGGEKINDQQLATLMSTFFTRSQQLQNDPQFQSLLQDPQLQEQLRSGNPLAILTNPKGSQLIAALLKPQTNSSDEPPIDTQPAATPNTTIYQWTDENGQRHFSDQQ